MMLLELAHCSQNDGQQEAALRDVTSQCEAESEGLEQDLAEAGGCSRPSNPLFPFPSS